MCRASAEARLAGITQELREQEHVLTHRFDESEASWSSLHSTLQASLQNRSMRSSLIYALLSGQLHIAAAVLALHLDT